MRALVTGGAGFVGSNLIKRLLEGYDNRITSLDNYTTGKIENQHKGCKYLHGDIRDYEAWGKFDVIFHMAALPRIAPSFKNPREVFETNVKGTQNVLEYARVYNIPVVYAGSSSFHGGVYKNPYTFTKWQGEELCKMYSNIFGVPTSICRFYNVYGDYMINEGAYRTVLSIFKEQYENGEPLTITGDGEQRRDFTHVDDIVDGMIRVMRAMNGEVDMFYHGAEFELGRGKNYSVNEVAEMFGITPEYKPAKPGEARNTLCEEKIATEILGWIPQKDLLNYIKEINDTIRTR